jgi:hypothetical protein
MKFKPFEVYIIFIYDMLLDLFYLVWLSHEFDCNAIFQMLEFNKGTQLRCSYNIWQTTGIKLAFFIFVVILRLLDWRESILSMAIP